ncbi:hypothetical protein Mesil_1904 [Allomeiothermus silvanus DSM 9946]|uniref:Uncharacterized protein n=1 Tax=Allomeiothermus silvanus (strain ATCC 700542 / DSM 9946 / NBRC 106475 / NCIMB 13440 / VI-R2) TaxID=526227 RepID=D7BGG3_ALLS1|nr:hypothetical protein [Allomeiothermus silvanus]ADH63779.1 hypothetical protein Mesil_1904 [Allomeiothermus silvanus DSM 9946]
MELTEIGWLGLVALIVGWVAGGQVVGGGISVSASVLLTAAPVHIYVTPITVWRLTHNQLVERLWGTGFTLGGTVVYVDPRPPATQMPERDINSLRTMIEQYELGHILGWRHYGLEYLHQIAHEACRYDPKALWAVHCRNDHRPPQILLPHTGAIRVVLP